MPVKIRELDPKTGKPKNKMPLPKPKPRHANPKHPMNTEKTKPLGRNKGGKMPLPISPRQMAKKKLKENYELTSMSIRDDEALKKKQNRQKTLLGKVFGSGSGKDIRGRKFAKEEAVNMLKKESPELVKRLTKKASGGSMKIKSGDTLSQIAKSKGLTLKALLAANPNIKNANKIRVGQSINIPGATSGAGAKSSNPYAGMTKTQMNMMDVKNKDTRKQEAVTRGMQAQGKMGGQRTPTKTSKNSQLDELRSRIRRAAAAKKAAPKSSPKAASKKSAPSMSGMQDDDYAARSGGMMNKKVMAYKKGGVMRGTGAATKGKGFSGCY